MSLIGEGILLLILIAFLLIYVFLIYYGFISFRREHWFRAIAVILFLLYTIFLISLMPDWKRILIWKNYYSSSP